MYSMQFNAKRRRLNDASSALCKPFKSPLRRPTAPDGKSPGKQTEVTEQAVSDSKSIANAPSSSRTATCQSPSSHSTPKNPRTPQRHLDASSNPTPNDPPLSSVSSAALLASLRKQESALLSRLASLRRELDTVSQALKIEQSGQDEELKVLIDKWRGASREAAEELFVGARDRVNRMGGVAAWKEKMKNARMRRLEWDAEEVRRQGNSDEEEDEGGEDIEAEKEKRRREIEDEVRAGEVDAVGAEGEEDESDSDQETFTMDMMLRSLNIDLNVIGYDKTNQRWLD
ncbi:hypothetical protein VTO42DRAFT_3935 [Malbranchea cinnamomea]